MNNFLLLLVLFNLFLYLFFLKSSEATLKETLKIPLIIMFFQSLTGLVILGSSEIRVLNVSILSFYFDNLSLGMFTFISFIGFIVYRYTIRFLLSDTKYGKFLSFLGLAISFSQLLVLSGNLIQLAFFWLLLSTSLHVLLEYYNERPRAVLAARKKFIISRIGDISLLLSVCLIFFHFKTTDIKQLYIICKGNLNFFDLLFMQLSGLGFFLAALCKSAQFPFHSWLPDTLEAPTPVSALMHAGIINAGGFLLIRMSGILQHAPIAMNLLVVFGTITATMATCVMWTQTSVKKSLAWSTVAQMGCMIMQCGLGAFGPALIHIFGHGFYKAHAFLVSGNKANTMQPELLQESPVRVITKLSFGLLISFLIIFLVMIILKLNLNEWPGGIVSFIVMLLALSQFMVPQFEVNQPSLIIRVLAISVIFFLIVLLEFIPVKFFEESFVHVTELSQRGILGKIITVLVITLFAILSVFSCLLPSIKKGSFLDKLYFHAMNGFYLGILADRLTRQIWPQKNNKISEERGLL